MTEFSRLWIRPWLYPIIFIDPNRVNLDDLISLHKPGGIVRCLDDPNECVKVVDIGAVGGAYDYVAGMVSEE